MSDLFSLKGRVALVTGASSGIGQHCAKVFASHGAQVVALARRAEALELLTAEIEAEGGQSAALVSDLMSIEDWTALVAAASEPFGAPDILFNGAGVNLRQHADEVTAEGWATTLHLNLTVPFFLAQALAPGMKQKGAGSIINVASLQSNRAFANGIAYGASKGGVSQLTRAMAEAWSSDGITANAIQPGFFPTELTAAVFGDSDVLAHHAAATTIGRNGIMPDLDGPLVFLASRASSYVTGHVLPVDGGYLAK